MPCVSEEKANMHSMSHFAMAHFAMSHFAMAGCQGDDYAARVAAV